MNQFSERFFESDIRMEQCFSLSLSPDVMALPDAVEDSLRDDCGDILEAAGVSVGVDIDEDEPSEIADYLVNIHERYGWFAQFSTPVRKRLSKSGAIQTSWGYYESHWIYSETLEECCSKALTWAKKRHAEMLVEAAQ